MRRCTSTVSARNSRWTPSSPPPVSMRPSSSMRRRPRGLGHDARGDAGGGALDQAGVRAVDTRGAPGRAARAPGRYAENPAPVRAQDRPSRARPGDHFGVSRAQEVPDRPPRPAGFRAALQVRRHDHPRPPLHPAGRLRRHVQDLPGGERARRDAGGAEGVQPGSRRGRAHRRVRPLHPGVRDRRRPQSPEHRAHLRPGRRRTITPTSRWSIFRPAICARA